MPQAAGCHCLFPAWEKEGVVWQESLVERGMVGWGVGWEQVGGGRGWGKGVPPPPSWQTSGLGVWHALPAPSGGLPRSVRAARAVGTEAAEAVPVASPPSRKGIMSPKPHIKRIACVWWATHGCVNAQDPSQQPGRAGQGCVPEMASQGWPFW